MYLFVCALVWMTAVSLLLSLLGTRFQATIAHNDGMPTLQLDPQDWTDDCELLNATIFEPQSHLPAKDLKLTHLRKNKNRVSEAQILVSKTRLQGGKRAYPLTY